MEGVPTRVGVFVCVRLKFLHPFCLVSHPLLRGTGGLGSHRKKEMKVLRSLRLGWEPGEESSSPSVLGLALQELRDEGQS